LSEIQTTKSMHSIEMTSLQVGILQMLLVREMDTLKVNLKCKGEMLKNLAFRQQNQAEIRHMEVRLEALTSLYSQIRIS